MRISIRQLAIQSYRWMGLSMLCCTLLGACGGSGSSSGDGTTPVTTPGITPGVNGTPPNANTPTNTVTIPPIAGAPVVLYTDIVSGPNTGGENGKGIYLSIFGKNFGGTGLGQSVKVYINNVEVVSLPLLSILHSPSIMRPVDPVSAQPSIVLQTSLD